MSFGGFGLKENLGLIESPLENLLKLNAYTFDWKKDALNPGVDDLKEQIGFMAQDVEAVYPNLVTHDSEADRYYLSYTGLIPITVEAIKEQQALIEGQQKLIEDLQRRLEALEQQAR